jgi:hypothetical protein
VSQTRASNNLGVVSLEIGKVADFALGLFPPDAGRTYPLGTDVVIIVGIDRTFRNNSRVFSWL